MKVTEEQLSEWAVRLLNYKVICDLFDLTDDERSNPNCGAWIIDRIKQYQTAYTINRAVKDRSYINGGVDAVPQANPIPPIDKDE